MQNDGVVAGGTLAPILAVEGVSKHFGGLAALCDVSFAVHEGEVLGLIGPNGAGKSTAINVISGFYRSDSGKKYFKGQDITNLAPHLAAAFGLVRTFQLDVSFEDLAVFDHIFLACLQAQRPSAPGLFFGSRGGRRSEREAKREAEALLDLMHLAPYAMNKPRQIPHGHRRWLSMAMALALKPSLILLDEPLSGMNASEIDDTLMLMAGIKRERGISLLLVEHNMRAVMNFCDRIVVINFGHKISEGTPAVVSRDPAVIEAYLGGEDDVVA